MSYLAGKSGARTIKKSLGKNEDGREIWKYMLEITCDCSHVGEYDYTNKCFCNGCGKRLL
jgi:hypothetical protein